MITKWRLENFKSVGNPTELDLGPLTILAGSNSSGKSTILQSMLLITQTLGNRISSRSVILNGPIVRLGAFDDLKTYNSENQYIKIGWEFNSRDEPYSRYEFPNNPRIFSRYFHEIEEVSCDLSIDAESDDENKELYQLQPRIVSSDISWIMKNENKKEESYSVNVKRTQNKQAKFSCLPKGSITKFRQALEYDIDVVSTTQKRRKKYLADSKPVGVNLRHFLPTFIVVDQSETLRFASHIISLISQTRSSGMDELEIIRDDPRWKMFSITDGLRKLFTEKLNKVPSEVIEVPDNFPNSLNELAEVIFTLHEKSPDTLRQLKTESFSNKIRTSLIKDYGEMRSLTHGGYREYGRLFDMSIFIEDYFSSKIKYLGPLREEPKPLYPLAGNDPFDVGIKGEHTAAVLDINRDREVTYISSLNFKEPSVQNKQSKLPLKEAVADWLKYMDVASDVITKDRGKFGRELKVTTNETTIGQDLTHVGVGVSQVLPILVLCLLAEPDSTIVIEQPELHLHPKVQTLLADFFLSMSLVGKQCILETHSEYLINRLRFRAAAADQDSFSSILKIYFVEKAAGRSNFRSVNVNKFGAIIDWPDGFFDQSQIEAESILRAASLKRKVEQRK